MTTASPTSSRSRMPRALAAAALASLLLTAGCSRGGADTVVHTRGPATGDTTPAQQVHDALPPVTSTTPPAPGTAQPALTVRTDEELTVHQRPDDNSPVIRTLSPRTRFGSPLALLVVSTAPEEDDWNSDDDGDEDDLWMQVLLPGRPNGATGWVDGDDVDVRYVPHTIDVDLASKVLTLRQDGETILTTPVAIGDPTHPTPTGIYSITDKIATDDPSGTYGPFAFGTSGRSDVLTEFAGGDGQIGIHGTNDASSIGRAASHGCIRVPNDVARQLNDLLALGTPVTIR